MEEKEEKKGFSDNQKWVFTVVICTLLLLLGGRLILADYKFDFTKFSFSELLALILALFSIGISVAFYFSASKSSSKFYDNTYKYTKDIAEFMVRIDSGFRLDLQHLNENYARIGDTIEKLPREMIEKKKAETQEELDKVKKDYEKKLKDQENLLNDKLQKAHSNEKDRQNIIDTLKEKENELAVEKAKVESLESKLQSYESLNEMENNVPLSVQYHRREMVASFIEYLNKRNILSRKIINYKVMDGLLNEYFEQSNRKGETELWFHFGLIDAKKRITRIGMNLIKDI